MSPVHQGDLIAQLHQPIFDHEILHTEVTVITQVLIGALQKMAIELEASKLDATEIKHLRRRTTDQEE